MAELDPMTHAMSDEESPFEGFSTDSDSHEDLEYLGTRELRSTQNQNQTNDQEAATKKQHESDVPKGSAGSTFKRGRPCRAPRAPGPPELRYSTSHYTPYDPDLRNTGETVHGKHTSFMAYDGYTLYMNPDLKQLSEIPTSGVRLDNMTIAFVLVRCSQATLHKKWPADFDARGMVKARRLPLGHAAKSWKSEGNVDIDGHVLTKAEEGFYYMWWRNIHCLCGKEGHDAKKYLIRPSHEQEGPKGFGFKVSSRAVVQLKAGEP